MVSLGAYNNVNGNLQLKDYSSVLVAAIIAQAATLNDVLT